MLPGKREARRLVGDHMLTQQDLMGLSGEMEDAVCIGGWNLDEHPSTGFDDPEKPPFVSIALREVYNIPLRSLYSKNVTNLLMAGRNISATHTAFTSTRVMATCAVEGQAVGTAAAHCARQGVLPRQLFDDKQKLQALQQTLLRNDQTIKGLKNEDSDDLARTATVTASAEEAKSPAAGVIDGYVRSFGGQSHRWDAPLGADGAWIELAWPRPVRLAHVQLTFDSGFQRELTLSASEGVNRHVIRAPQPETVKDYVIQYRPAEGADWIDLARIEGNHQRLCRHAFDPVDAASLRINVLATNGDPLARIFEIRCYG
jgi:hypothetical protein